MVHNQLHSQQTLEQILFLGLLQHSSELDGCKSSDSSLKRRFVALYFYAISKLDALASEGNLLNLKNYVR